MVGVSLVLLLGIVITPRLIKSKLIQVVQTECRTCRLKVQNLSFSLSELRLNQINFSFEDRAGVVLDTEIKSVTIPFQLTSFFTDTIRIGRIQIQSPQVVLREYDSGPGPLPPVKKEKSSKKTYFEADGIDLVDGYFEYDRIFSDGRNAPIRIRNIRVDLGRYGTTPNLADKDVVAQTYAILEQSGKIDLKLMVPVFTGKPIAKIFLKLNGQKLHEIDGYFLTAEGLNMKGLLVNSDVFGELNDHSLTGKLKAHYHSLDLHFHEHKKRSAFEALLSNIGKDIKLKETNIGVPKPKIQHPIASVRQPQESIISFILRGMKEAAIEVAGG